MNLTVNGIEHVFDGNGVCQRHGDVCSMAPSSPDEKP